MSKQEADNLKSISIAFLNKHDYFCGWRSGTITWTRSGMWGESKNSVSISVSVTDEDDRYLKITYTQTDNWSEEKKDFEYKIPLTTTPCNFGGKRYWFICPWYKNGVYCGNRVGTLYKGGDYFACRHCYELTYKSRNQNRRNSYFPVFNVLDLSERIEELENEITVRYYNGKPTKKYKKLLKLYAMQNSNYEMMRRLENDILL
ncbi:hypothetical protein H6776_02720 [Candidatus Nomurabacteria bacterium]|nr:hypothetical protein [Candidatus Nomurabacteria bacterium]